MERRSGQITKRSMLAYSCHQAHSNLGSGIETSPPFAARDAQEQARGPMGGGRNDTGGKDERLREYRIGHFWLQARGGCDCGGRIGFGSTFIPGDIRIPAPSWRNGGKARLETRL